MGGRKASASTTNHQHVCRNDSVHDHHFLIRQLVISLLSQLFDYVSALLICVLIEHQSVLFGAFGHHHRQLIHGVGHQALDARPSP
jgi:hypothetical protein